MNQGTYAAFNMLGKLIPYGDVPFFWTRNFNNSLQYVGNTSSFDDVHIDGDISKDTFLAYYIKDGKIVAALGSFSYTSVMTL